MAKRIAVTIEIPTPGPMDVLCDECKAGPGMACRGVTDPHHVRIVSAVIATTWIQGLQAKTTRK